MAYLSLEEIVKDCEEKKMPFFRAVMENDMQERGVSEKDSKTRMAELWQAMRDAAKSYDAGERSNSGLVGGAGGRMEEYRRNEEPLCGTFVSRVIAEALKMGECNACMKRIVAAPTAGACGVLPAVLVPFFEEHETEENVILEALYTAAGIGQVIAARAYIAGASGGCQAEIGTASAMAAGALVHLRGGSPRAIVHAAAMAIKNILGLVCDPVAGLVEVPCVKRNVIGAMDALSSADMALAGIESRIPPDQVIDAMKEVGDLMSVSLKETGESGLAGTPEGRSVQNRMFAGK